MEFYKLNLYLLPVNSLFKGITIPKANMKNILWIKSKLDITIINWYSIFEVKCQFCERIS